MILTLFLIALVPAALACPQRSSSDEDGSSGCKDSGIENNIFVGKRRRCNENDDSSENAIDSNGCPNGWKLFQRARGAWCIGAFYNGDGNMVNWDDAQQRCQLFSAVLTGVESAAERDYINQTLLPQWTSTLGLVWLGARRNPACHTPNWLTGLCDSKLTCYDWTDGFTSGTNGYLWGANAPDGQLNIDKATGAPQSCMVMYMAGGADYHLGWLDDQWCYARNDQYNLRGLGYACGKQPEF